MRNRKTRVIFFSLGITLLALAYMAYLNEKAGLRLELEGLYLDKNFRDVAASLNQCARDKSVLLELRSDLLFRANKWFSGWDCDQVKNPEIIVSLNYQPQKQWQYYCSKAEGENVVGYHANSKFELNNIEFLNTWEGERDREAICKHINVILQSVAAEQRTLFHCEAGRDRTGAVAAITAALIFEYRASGLDEAMLDLIECDYQKSASLKKHKYGRMRTFLSETVEKYGSVSQFIAQKCNITSTSIAEFAAKMNETR